jgi:SAM-dependent methyltransferase
MVQDSGRKEFLAKMFEEALKAYERPGEEWSEDEKEFLPIFTRLVEFNRLILDLAGGYGRVTPYLLEGGNIVVLGDLSLHSLMLAKKIVPGRDLHIVRMDLLHLPFVDNTFDGVWFTQAFEYIPPDKRKSFLESLRAILKPGGVVFLNVAKVPNECSFIFYLKNYLYWKIVKRKPIIWGEYIYKLHSKTLCWLALSCSCLYKKNRKNLQKSRFQNHKNKMRQKRLLNISTSSPLSISQ